MIGETIGGKYRIIELIGSGGMAKVYKAEHLVIGQEVAIKIIKPHLLEEAPDFAKRFLGEARIGFKLKHHNIATLYDAGEENGLLYIVMEFVKGETLKEIVARNGQLRLGAAKIFIKDIAAALDYIHGRDLIHRDVKSGNIMIRESDNVPILMDFGIARAATGTRLTQTGFQMGTPEYMSPEQAQGKPATKSSDIYALGIVAYEMLTGRTPFSSDTPAVTLLNHLSKPPPPINVLRSDVPPGVENAVMLALAKDPDKRYASAGDFARALETGESSTQPSSMETRRAAPVEKEEPETAQASLITDFESGFTSDEEQKAPETAQSPWRPPAEVRDRIAPARSYAPATSRHSKRVPVLLLAGLIGVIGIATLIAAIGISLGWFGSVSEHIPAASGSAMVREEPKYGQIDIKTKPDRAEVFVDSQQKGVTPLEITQLEVGIHKVEIRKSTYVTYQADITIVENVTSKVDIKLEPSKCPPGFTRIKANGSTIKQDFCMKKTEVTNAEYRECVNAGACEDPYANGECFTSLNNKWNDYPVSRIPSAFKKDNLPVVCVTYNMAVKFAEWKGENYKLPTAEEWEYAARAGTNGKRYWGDSLKSACKYENLLDSGMKDGRAFGLLIGDWVKPAVSCNDGYKASSPVASFKANPWGLYDMLGNVAEIIQGGNTIGSCWAGFVGDGIDYKTDIAYFLRVLDSHKFILGTGHK